MCSLSLSLSSSSPLPLSLPLDRLCAIATNLASVV
ncbi:hypothetical protein SLEP1_g15519 [Rubroshorea leprosula]|uniref:Uncharacterized protein n=1 Tax=Rubroshorea leprosula TaxID=152421 RepID=A0AAV5IWH4_9ROSI|nr:hypothetical protein SLEP1_g15519 [Rubroshorea leprosula]